MVVLEDMSTTSGDHHLIYVEASEEFLVVGVRLYRENVLVG
jgi:hypothetical protein